MVHKHYQKEEARVPEARLRRVIEQSPLGVHVFMPDGRSLQANGAWNEIWNLRKEEEPEGTNIFEDDQLRAAGLTAYIEDAVASASVVVTPPLRHDPARTGREGEPRWLWAYIYPVKNGAGWVIETALLLEDVTERKEAEEALQRSESRLAEAQRIAHVGNWEYEVKKDEAYWSDEMYRISGRAPQEFVPRYSTFLRSIHHDDRETVRRAVRKALYGGKQSGVEYRIVRPDGTVRNIYSQYEVFRDEAGEAVRIVGISHDITERKEAEEVLRESEARNKAILDVSPDLMFLLGRAGEVLDLKAAGKESKLYAPPEEIAGKRLGNLLPDEIADMFLNYIARALDTGETQVCEYRLPVSEGVRDFEARLVKSGANEVLSIVRDVTEHKRSEELLRQQSAAMTASMDGVAILDESGAYTYMNNAHAKIYGYDDPEELLGKTWKVLYDEGEVERFERAVEPVFREHGQWRGEAIGKKRDGSAFVQEVSLTGVEGGGIVCVVRDITERKETEARLRESEERFRGAFENAPIGVALVNLDGHYFKVNQTLCEMLGYSEEELLEKTSLEIVHPDNRKISEDYMRRAIEGELESYTLERRYICADGRVVWNLTSVSLIQASQGDPSHFVCLHQDTTERKALEERLEHQAFHDPLTGLANRALFMNRLEQALARLDRRREPIAVLFVDLDNFKYVNDSLNHEAGDRLLVEVGERLKVCVRPEDTVSRFGGDEFAVLLEGIADLSGASRVAERITETLKAPFHLEGREVFASTSIGIAPATKALDEPGDLLRNADMALYRAKEKGKARYEFFDESMGAEALKRLELEGALRKALEREEFRIYYQPKISVSDSKIVSLEALVRWEHPERGLLEPDEFLLAAEETGLIVPLGEWVIDTVCRQGRVWQERFADRPPPRVCTNISAKQFFQTDLVGRVNESLRKSGLRAQGLSLEIAESVLMEDVEDNIEKLTALKELGINIVIDDFGTSYSALSELKNFPLNTLKIDRSLTVKLGEEPEDKAIVAAMINLAQALGWAVTAHGVETEEQLTMLRELGCDIVQGYYFTRPVTSEEATTLLEEDLLKTTGA